MSSDTKLSHKYKKKEIFQHETLIDNELQLICKYILKGWPNQRNLLPSLVKPYFLIADQLTIIDCLVFKAEKLVLPKSLRKEMLNKIHYSHLGMEKCKLRAREIMYWPLMNKEIEDLVASCAICMQFKKNNNKQSLMLRDIPNEPWVMIGLDLFYFRGSNWLLIIDCFSKYIEVVKLQTSDSISVINILKSIFARFGIAKEMCSDNGLQFGSFAMRKFTIQWNIDHKTSMGC